MSLLVTPSTIPFTFVAPGVAHAYQRYLTLHATRLYVNLKVDNKGHDVMFDANQIKIFTRMTKHLTSFTDVTLYAWPMIRPLLNSASSWLGFA